MNAQTYYNILDVEASASEKEIRDAYRKKMLEVHPDLCERHDASERAKIINQAADVLLDSVRRARYDAFLEKMRSQQSKANSQTRDARTSTAASTNATDRATGHSDPDIFGFSFDELDPTSASTEKNRAHQYYTRSAGVHRTRGRISRRGVRVMVLGLAVIIGLVGLISWMPRIRISAPSIFEPLSAVVNDVLQQEPLNPSDNQDTPTKALKNDGMSVPDEPEPKPHPGGPTKRHAGEIQVVPEKNSPASSTSNPLDGNKGKLKDSPFAFNSSDSEQTSSGPASSGKQVPAPRPGTRTMRTSGSENSPAPSQTSTGKTPGTGTSPSTGTQKNSNAQALGALRVQGEWAHYAGDNQSKKMNVFDRSGRVSNATHQGTWSIADQGLELNWNSIKETDKLTLLAGDLLYVGTNKRNLPIYGVKVTPTNRQAFMSNMVGGNGGAPFGEIPSKGIRLAGFHVCEGKNGPLTISYLRPVFVDSKGFAFEGKGYGYPTSKTLEVGINVGQRLEKIEVHADNLVRGMKFHVRSEFDLDKPIQIESIGAAHLGKSYVIDMNQGVPIGVFGRSWAAIDAFGIVFREKDKP